MEHKSLIIQTTNSLQGHLNIVKSISINSSPKPFVIHFIYNQSKLTRLQNRLKLTIFFRNSRNYLYSIEIQE